MIVIYLVTYKGIKELKQLEKLVLMCQEGESWVARDDLHQQLFDYFGYKEFKDNQEEVIKQVIAGSNDVLFVAPTGAGKSMCFQLPALMSDDKT